MRCLLIPADLRGEYLIIPLDQVQGVYQTRVFPVPLSEEPFTGVSVIEDELVPVMASLRSFPVEGFVVVYMHRHKRRGVLTREMPEIMDVEGDDLGAFARTHDVKLLAVEEKQGGEPR